MKLLVTGGAGYVGSVCAQVLLEAGHEVVVVDNFTTGNRAAVPADARLVEGDVRDVAAEVLAEGGFDGVIHFAARSLVGESMEKPEEYWQHNVVTSLALLDAMRANGVTNLVFSSTAATYGEPEVVPITEDMPTSPTNPYGASKLAIDYIITSYAQAHGLGATSLRYFNVAGAYGQIGENREIETHLIPLVLQVASATGTRSSCSATTGPRRTAPGARLHPHPGPRRRARPRPETNEPGTHRIYNLGSGDVLRPAGHRDVPTGHRPSHPRRGRTPARRRPGHAHRVLGEDPGGAGLEPDAHGPGDHRHRRLGLHQPARRRGLVREEALAGPPPLSWGILHPVLGPDDP